MNDTVAGMVEKLKQCFQDGQLNYFNDFVAHRGANRRYGAACCKIYGCETEEDVIAAALEQLTIDCCKTEPFETKKANGNFRKYMLKGMNKLLGKAFTEKQYFTIYLCIGNGINHQLTLGFIRSGYSIKFLRDSRPERMVSVDALLAELNKLEYRAKSLDQMRGGNDVMRRLLPKLISEQPFVEVCKICPECGAHLYDGKHETT